MRAGDCAVCVAVLLCLTPVTGQEEEEFVMCEEACERYQDWGEKCVVESGCPHMSAEDKAACHDRCLSVFEHCQTLCLQNYQPLNDTCEHQCQNSSIMDVFCDVECFGEQLATHYMKGVPELKPEQVIEVVEGPPLSPEAEDNEEDSFLEDDSSEVEASLEDEDSSMEELFNELEHELSQEEISSDDVDIDHVDNDNSPSPR